MSKVIVELSMSSDGFIAGPNDGVDKPLGDGGERLFKWYYSGDTDFPLRGTDMVFKISRASAELLRVSWPTIGAAVTGRRTFDIAGGWGGKPPGGDRILSLPIQFHKNGSRKDRRSPSSRTALKAPLKRRNKPQAIRMSM